jgi:hypothetical protein
MIGKRVSHYRIEEQIGAGGMGVEYFPDQLSTVGITPLVLIFRPYRVKEFEMTCEGPEKRQGRAAWNVRFEQRMDQPARMSALRVGRRDLLNLSERDGVD